ncbi:ComEA family DNA-binding protein [Neisseria sp. P0019.S003]|uniref:ComEA family DNA-binding protein n=1 Tax=Neisseria sp. P0019.S003 TaxID=3436799 RepID=UPI003F7D6FC9
MKKFLFGAFAAICAAFSLAAVNINTASSAELEALPGIGPAKAEATVSSAAPKAAQPAVKK